MPFVIVDFKEVRRALSRTPVEPARLTRDGLIHDYVHYRWNRAGVEDTLDAGGHRLPAALRTPGTAMVLVSLRVWDDDVDMIEFFDPDTGYHALWSTEPEYTSGLSRWEHHQYLAMIKAGKGGAISDTDRLLAKATFLRQQDEDLPQLPFRDRAVGTALVEAEGYRRASGPRVDRPGFLQPPGLALSMTPGGADREDLPTVPPQTSTRKRDRRRGRKAPERDARYGFAALERPADPRVEGDLNADVDDGVGNGGPPDGNDAGSGAERAALDRWTALAAATRARSTEAEDEAGLEYHLRQDDEPDEDDHGGSAASYDERDDR